MPVASVQCQTRSSGILVPVSNYLFTVVVVGARAAVTFRRGRSVWVELWLTYISWFIYNTVYGDHLRIGPGAVFSFRAEPTCRGVWVRDCAAGL